MAKMIPNVDPATIGIEPERDVYVALRDRLPRRYVVFHSYPWLRMWRGDRDKALAEGEADFVVLHPRRGLLILEVKGGEIEYVDGEWYRRTSQGLKAIRNPFEQARRNMHAILDIFRDHSRGRLKSEHLVHGYAVVFPNLEYRGRPPAYADRAIILSQRHLRHPAAAIEEAYDRWTAQPLPLEAARFEALLRCLTPEFHFFRPLGSDLAADAERIQLLTEAQSGAAQALLTGSRRICVQGPAGCGKTELALHSAVAKVTEGAAVLLLCFNRELAVWLRERTAGLTTEDGDLQIWSFHALAADLARRARVAWESNRAQMDQEFWDEEAPEIMGQAAAVLEANNESARFDVVIVDEGQDFRPLWWYVLEQDMLQEGGSMQVFYDLKQSLWGDAEAPPLDFDQRISLDMNCRNTRRVAEFSANVAEITTRVHSHTPEGVDVNIFQARTGESQAGLVTRRVREFLSAGLSPSQIALIGPASKEHGSLASIGAVAGTQLTTSPAEWRAGGGLLVTTARKFKGLEAPAVIVYDIGGLGGAFTDADLYVACSRAVSILEVVVHHEEVRARLRQAKER